MAGAKQRSFSKNKVVVIVTSVLLSLAVIALLAIVPWRRNEEQRGRAALAEHGKVLPAAASLRGAAVAPEPPSWCRFVPDALKDLACSTGKQSPAQPTPSSTAAWSSTQNVTAPTPPIAAWSSMQNVTASMPTTAAWSSMQNITVPMEP